MERQADWDKIIIGIDPGTNVMGYGILGVRQRKPELIAMGVIMLSKFDDRYMRLRRIAERVTGLVEQYLPDEMALEAPFYGKNVQSMLKLGRSAEVARRQGPEKDHRRTGQNHQHRNLNDRSAEYAIRGRSENFSPESFNRSAIRRSDRTDEIYACSSVRTASKYHNPT